MERILTTAQMRAADKFTIENLGVCEKELVERAGGCIADEIISRFKGGRVLVCVGKGNNGADGRVVADILSKKHGFTVAVLTVSNGIFKLFDKKFDIIVDCIFGTGLSRTVEGNYKDAIEKINRSGAYVISCDIPSGLNGDTGKAMGVAVKANLTVAIQEYKLGHFLNDGPDYCGIVVAKDIGISIWGEEYVKKLNDSSISRLFAKRKENTNKGDYGKCCIIGGSKQFTGSVILSSSAACSLRTGVGYAALLVPDSLFNAYVGKVPECILSSFNDKNGFINFRKDDFDKFLNYDSIAIGMGMGISEEVYKTIKYLLENYTGNLIIDADGLNSIAQFGLEILKNKKCKLVLSPHVGEFCRLAKISKDELLDDPINIAQNFANKYDLTLLLKSSVSIITDGQNTYLNTTGTPAMAKAGSGDVLSGLLAGLAARNDDLIFVSAVASYIFGRCGEYVVREQQNEYTALASDLISALPKVIHSLR